MGRSRSVVRGDPAAFAEFMRFIRPRVTNESDVQLFTIVCACPGGSPVDDRRERPWRLS